MLAREYKTEIMGLNNLIESYKGEIDRLRHELAATKHHLDDLVYGPAPKPLARQVADRLVANKAVHETTARELARELRNRIRRRIASSLGFG
jgi:hypothetical protein